MVTFNSTSWGHLKSHLPWISADVILWQEHHLASPEDLDRASEALQFMGWKCVLAPALQGKSFGSSSGGVGILVRDRYGLVPQLQLASSHRLVLAVMNLPSGKSLTIGSLYCIDGLAMVGENLRLLAEAASGVQHLGHPFVLGADFQNSPEVVESTGILARLDAVLVHTPSTQTTCRSSAGTSRVIDYFIIERHFAHAVSLVNTLDDVAWNPHRPVKVAFHPTMEQLKVLVLAKPAEIDK